MCVREETVLQPRKASNQNPDNWPQFNFKQVTITSLKTGQDASLLSAHQHNPLKVTGRLEAIDDDLMHLVRDRSYTNKTINLEQVTRYAFAEYDDGSCGFWAAGKAGWFEIQSPASPFKTTYEKMNEAASIFYMLADRLRRTHRRARNLGPKELKIHARKVFQAYVTQRKDPAYPADVDEARTIFHEHRVFLITSMLEGQDGLNWTQTPMLHYFKLKFPDEYAVIEARVLQPAAATAAAESRSELQSEVFPKDSRDSSRKRKSKSPHVDSNPKKQKRRAAQQAESRIQLLPKGLVPRTPRQEPLEMRSSDENDSDNSNAVGRKQKSILQPSGGKYSKKAAARRRGLSALQQLDGSQDEEDGDNYERALSEESPIPTMHNPRDPEEFTNPQSNRSSLDAASSPDLLPRKYLELKVVEYDLPSTEPQGPGDLWTCTFEGCFYRVHEASTSEGKTRMKEHFRTHASQAQEKIDLVLNERRPYLPVNNLVRRLQAFAPPPETELGPESPEQKLPAPIRRRY